MPTIAPLNFPADEDGRLHSNWETDCDEPGAQLRQRQRRRGLRPSPLGGRHRPDRQPGRDGRKGSSHRQGHPNLHHWDLRQTTQALHHLLLEHGLALAKIKANDPKAQHGIVCKTGVFDPLMLGAYPQDLFRLRPGCEPLDLLWDMEIIATPIAFQGLS